MTTPTHHNQATRVVHACLAVAIVVQLASSLGMVPAEHGHAGNLLFQAHRASGLAAFALLLAFWAVAMTRRVGTPLGAIFPWLSSARLSALRADLRRHLAALFRLRLPAHEDGGALPSAIHGLGLCLVSAMAATGTIYALTGAANPEAPGLAGWAMVVHQSLANLVWAYLVGHAAMALLHHVGSEYDLRRMWSLGRGTPGHGDV